MHKAREVQLSFRCIGTAVTHWRIEATGGEADHQGGEELVVAPARPQLRKPPMYKVVLLNDDYTPMDFVVEVLEHFFHMDTERATQVMLTIHTQGKGICGVYTRDVAETKAEQVNSYSRECQHPLLCKIEKAD